MSGGAADSMRIRHPRRYALAALQGAAERLANTPGGDRNDTLVLAARRVRRRIEAGALTEQEVRDILRYATDRNAWSSTMYDRRSSAQSRQR